MADKIITVDELISLLKGKKYKYSQIHHTYKPDHSNFNGKNHLKLQQGMRNYHVNTRGWNDIGQHVTLMPDGMFVTGRNFNSTPAGISGYNTSSFMVEMLGNFDTGKDKLQGKQLDAMLKLQHFLVNQCGAEIMFHREHAPKTCPGSGINKGEFLKQVFTYGQKEEVKKLTPKFPGIISKGSRGEHVKLIQKKVGAKPDGIFGPMTEKLVDDWKEKLGYRRDGIVGPTTWSRMFEDK